MENRTITSILQQNSEKYPDKVGFSFPEFNKEYTYKEFKDEVDIVAKGLLNLGVEKGDNVAIWMLNIPEWFILFFSVVKIGAIAVPINTSFKITEMRHVLDSLDIKHVAMSEGFSKDYPDIIDSLIPGFKNGDITNSNVKNFISIGFENKNTNTMEKLKIFGEKISDDELRKREEQVENGDTNIILPTSGTTGFPKGALLSLNALIRNGYDIGERLDLQHDDNMLVQVPMFHCFGITLSLISSLTHVSKLTILSHFSASLSIDIVKKEKITCLNGVPTMFERIINSSKFNKNEMSSLKKGIMAGCNCLPSFIQKIMNEADMKIVVVYGLTEASPACTMTSVFDSDYCRINTVGKCMPGVECKVIDPETGMDCNENEEGEIIIRGYNLMKGYYNKPDETNKAIENGWLHTGDIGMKNNDGYFIITGRIKDIIIRGGENISPKEIEVLINDFPGVSSTAVFGVDDETYGQKVMACVIPLKNEGFSGDQIKSFLKGKCASYKIPECIDIVESLPTSPTGKVLTRELRNLYRSAESLPVSPVGKIMASDLRNVCGSSESLPISPLRKGYTRDSSLSPTRKILTEELKNLYGYNNKLENTKKDPILVPSL